MQSTIMSRVYVIMPFFGASFECGPEGPSISPRDLSRCTQHHCVQCRHQCMRERCLAAWEPTPGGKLYCSEGRSHQSWFFTAPARKCNAGNCNKSLPTYLNICLHLCHVVAIGGWMDALVRFRSRLISQSPIITITISKFLRWPVAKQNQYTSW